MFTFACDPSWVSSDVSRWRVIIYGAWSRIEPFASPSIASSNLSNSMLLFPQLVSLWSPALSLEEVNQRHRRHWHHYYPVHSTLMAAAILSDVNPTPMTIYPALLPPHGVTPNFIDPYTRGPVLTIVGSILVAIMMFFVVARAYTKTCINRKVHWDDC